uniref:Uncharacterized protein n=1 Tax=Peromyscus maniculatus bairdii TaxID=230844 RepID=A0A8C8UC43_PERMB
MILVAENELWGAVLLMCPNKQDLPNTMNATETTDKPGCTLQHKNWYFQVTCATNGISSTRDYTGCPLSYRIRREPDSPSSSLSLLCFPFWR